MQGPDVFTWFSPTMVSVTVLLAVLASLRVGLPASAMIAVSCIVIGANEGMPVSLGLLDSLVAR